jgi:hypothetical protein
MPLTMAQHTRRRVQNASAPQWEPYNVSQTIVYLALLPHLRIGRLLPVTTWAAGNYIYHVHASKTGGTTVEHVLRDLTTDKDLPRSVTMCQTEVSTGNLVLQE